MINSRDGRRSRRNRSAAQPASGSRTTQGQFLVLVCLLLVLTLVLGGGGTSNPATELTLQCIASLLLLGWVVRSVLRRSSRSALRAQAILRDVPRPALALAVLVIILPLLQLVPLPPAIWHALPGREQEIATLALIGQSGRWMPWTMTPANTFASLLAIVFEVAFFIMVTRLDLVSRMWLCLVVGCVGLASVVLGCLQLSQAGGYTWSLYSEANLGWVLGFHANRNAATDTMQIAMMAIAACLFVGARLGKVAGAWIGTCLFLILTLALGAILTGSRTGILLLPLTCGCVAWMLWPLLPQRKNRLLLAGIAVAVVATLPVLISTAPVQQALARFSEEGEHRWAIWHDTWRAIGAVWPMGSGIGSFSVVFASAQSLERMVTLIDARAHNDWLEWLLEAGLPGVVILFVSLGIVVFWALRGLVTVSRRRADPLQRAQVIFAVGSLLHFGLHAMLDYPIRSMALAALMAVAVAMLLPASRQRKNVPI